MNVQLMELLDETKKLTIDERIQLADLLYADSLVPNAEWEATWAAESQRRIETYRHGKTEAIDADEVHAQIDAEFGFK